LFLLCAAALFAQTASVRGIITDESGAVIPGAKVSLTPAAGDAKTTTAATDGTYSFTGLTPGEYGLQASAPELSMPAPVKIVVRGGNQVLNLQLKVAATAQQVTVRESGGPAVSADPSNNASALVIRGEDLDALSDSPEDLAADLKALAGPAAG